MSEILAWLGQPEHSKPLALVLFFMIFVGILVYVFTGKSRKQRLESYKYIPFADDERDEKETDNDRQAN
ncbi:MAG TPA: cbb3-type cytochrome c oxidase subunit 3 [Chromatiaceae bacterium]|nr:cbb3-type cytochrome c oxidase subunit 3 [Chromatiaceae bacterium]